MKRPRTTCRLALAFTLACAAAAAASPPRSAEPPASTPDPVESAFAAGIESVQAAGAWAESRASAAWRWLAGTPARAAALGALARAAAPRCDQGLYLFTPRPEVAGLDPRADPDDARDWTAVGAGATLPDRVVILVHGLNDTGGLWNELAAKLQAAGFACARFEYANDGSISDAADRLVAALAQARAGGVERVDLVGHSMGGLVARDAATRPAGAGRNAEIPRIERLITVGTPHGGAALARLWWLSEVREHAARFLDGEGRSPLALLGMLGDGAGQAGADMTPGSAYLAALDARPLPPGLRVTVITGQVAAPAQKAIDRVARSGLLSLALSERSARRLTAAAGRLSRSVGDGVVSARGQAWDAAADTVTLPANHESLLRSFTAEEHLRRALRLKPSGTPPAIPVILERLHRPMAE